MHVHFGICVSLRLTEEKTHVHFGVLVLQLLNQVDGWVLVVMETDQQLILEEHKNTMHSGYSNTYFPLLDGKKYTLLYIPPLSAIPTLVLSLIHI